MPPNARFAPRVEQLTPGACGVSLQKRDAPALECRALLHQAFDNLMLSYPQEELGWLKLPRTSTPCELSSDFDGAGKTI